MSGIVRQLAAQGQSLWLDYIHRDLLASGGLQSMIGAGLLGMTSNPTIFEKAVAGGGAYDETVRRLAREGASDEAIADAIAREDVGAAADIFRPVYDATAGRDGYVSIEVSPRLARDGAATLAEARRLWKTLARPNVMIKIPATPEGLPAIESALAEGIAVNVTLMFSMAHYEAVADAWLRGLERRLATGEEIRASASVASFFVSRVDTKADAALKDAAPALRGRVAIANSRRVFARFREILSGHRFRKLAERGARPQRLLWASTSTKDPALPDTLYVDSLVGPDTVNTVPQETWEAVLAHGSAERTVDRDPAGDERVLREAAAAGLDLDRMGEALSREGVDKFLASHEALVAAIARRRKVVVPA